MKIARKISLFFIYPMTMFGLGFFANMSIAEFFYPGSKQPQNKEQIISELPKEEEPVLAKSPAMVTANTCYVVQDYSLPEGEVSEQIETAPDKFIGLSRTQLEKEIESYNQNPSLADQKKGFSYMELVSFSGDRVVIRKSYETKKADDTGGFFLINENHRVVVYNKELTQPYMSTDILVESLPEELQKEIIQKKFVEDEGNLYDFLESYSS